MKRSLRTPALLVRHALSNVGASVLVAVLVLLVSFVVAVAPRALTQLSTSELRHELDGLAATVRDVGNSAVLNYTAGDGATDLPADLAPQYGLMDEALTGVLDAVPQPLRAALDAPDYFGRVAVDLPADSDDTTKNGVKHFVNYAADPRIESRVTMTAGTFPEVADQDDPIEVTMSTDTAKEMAWDVGEVRSVGSVDATRRVKLTGTFEPVDATADYWQHATSVVIPRISDDLNSPRQVTATAFVAPEEVAAGPVPLDAMALTVWYPLHADTIDISEATTIQPQLRKFVGTVHSLPGRYVDQPFSLETGTLDAMDTALSRTAVTSAVLSMAASGPLGVVLAVFALGARSVVERRRPALALAAARGGSAWQIRGAMALEGLVLGVIPGAISLLVAVLVVPVATSASAYLPAIVLALAPAVLFALAGSPSDLRATRADLDPRSRGRVRRVTELLVVALAIVSVILLVRRGLVTSGTFDPLLAATPLLLSLAVCVGVLRLYPFPLYAIERRLRRRRGLIGFVGAARAVRDPAVGVAAPLAIVVAVSVAVFSATLLSTINTAVAASALTSVGGGDLAAQSRFFSDDQRAAIAGIDGITAIAGIDDQGDTALRDSGGGSNVDLLEADAATLATIRDDIPAHLDTKVTGAIPVVMSDDLASKFDSLDGLTLQGQPITVVAVLPTESGLGAHDKWVLVDTSFARSMVDLAFAPQLLIMTTDAHSQQISDAVVAADSLANVTTYNQALAETRDSPTVAGLGIALYAAILAVAFLAALAVILTSVINAPARNRAIGALRTLGLSSRQTAGLVAWELAPVVLTALIAGTLLGLALPLVVTSTVDLGAFTGGTPVTGPHFDPVLIAIVLGVVVLATIAAAAVAVVLSLRRTPASTVKIGAD